ncbi:MAG: amino acid ABC transporter ATP-binding protein [Rhodoglobus sp.]
MSENTPLLEVRKLDKQFGDVVALKDVDLTVQRGEIIAIIGPSGSGKSTLIRCINMLESYEGGSVHLGGEQLGFTTRGRGLTPLTPAAIAAQRSRMGMVFQQFNLFPHLTVLENIIDAPVQILRHKKASAIAEARRLLSLVKLSDKEKSYPRHLSGGQQQRVAIARALAMSPELLLFDEPTSALDPETVGEVLQVMKDVAALGTTMIVVTHEIEFAREICDRVVFMESGQIIEQGLPGEILDNPSERLTAFIRGRVA